jgi:hypothetical protein
MVGMDPKHLAMLHALDADLAHSFNSAEFSKQGNPLTKHYILVLRPIVKGLWQLGSLENELHILGGYLPIFFWFFWLKMA